MVRAMGLYDRDYMRSRDNSGRAPGRRNVKFSGRHALVIVIAIIMIMIFVIAYVV